MENFKKLNVAILGKSYSITTDEKESDVYAAVEMVDSLMKTIADKANLQDYSKVAVLAALQLASDLNKSRKQFDSLQERVGNLDFMLSKYIEKE